MVVLGFKMYLYIGILPLVGSWSYAMESSLCTATLMRIVDQCTEVNLLGKAWMYLLDVETECLPTRSTLCLVDIPRV